MSNHLQKIDRELANIFALGADLANQNECWHSRPTTIQWSLAGSPAVLDDLLPMALTCVVHAVGGRLAPDLMVPLDRLREHGTWLVVESDGEQLERDRFLALRDVTQRFVIDLDTHVASTHHALHPHTSLDRVCANLEVILPLAKADGTQILFRVTLTEHNLAELPDHVRFLGDLGGEMIQVREPLLGSDDRMAMPGADDRIASVIDRTQAIARERKIDLYLDLRAPFQHVEEHLPRDLSKASLAVLRERFQKSVRTQYPGFCHVATNHLNVAADGVVFPCHRAPVELQMGNLRSESFAAVWNGARYRAFRRRMFGSDYPRACRSCPVLTGNPGFAALRRSP
ncbi:MAG: SPASM domain-containing protein [Planctomycetota bacterium]